MWMSLRLSRSGVLIAVIAVFAVLILVVSLAVWAGSDRSPLASPVDCTASEAQTAAEAGLIASHCGKDVEVLEERTPWQTSWEMADGLSRVEISVSPVRVVSSDGRWVDLDTTLVHDEAAGVVRVAAPLSPITLNAGGEAGAAQPLGSLSQGEHTMQMWFPLDLPVPVLGESQAIYPLGEGIVLYVNVNTDGSGFMPVVELADPAAAARFEGMLEAARLANGGVSEGMDIEFRTTHSEGLTMVVDDEAGAVFLVDDEGMTVFMFASAGMWDSSGEPYDPEAPVTEAGVPDRTRSPAGGDRIEMMQITLSDPVIVVTPDAGMLTSEQTVWPVYIDPTTANNNTPHEWIAVRSGGFTSSLWKWGDISSSMLGQGLGYCTVVAQCNALFRIRLLWEFTGLSAFGAMNPSDIKSAEFRVNGVHSANCTAQRTDLYRTSDISTSSTWNNVSWHELLSYRTEYHSNGCGGVGFKSYPATAAIQWLAANNASTVTLGLRANSEANMTTWKRFRHDAKLDITYNRPPHLSTTLKLASPDQPCVSGENRPHIATTTPTLSAVISDPDGDMVRAHFQITPPGSETIVWASGTLTAQASGSLASATVSGGSLVHGQTYRYRLTVFDNEAWSGWTPTVCEFTVDTIAPIEPTLQPIRSSVQAVYEQGRERGGVGLQGKFQLSRGASTDVVSFHYSFNNPALTQSAAPDSSGLATIAYTPSSDGPVTLRVATRDKAGNQSPTVTYAFDVAAAKEDGVWMLDEGAGATAADTSGVGVAKSLAISGAVWSTGPHELFQSRPGDGALLFDGVDDAAETAPIVDTTASFVVSAYVWLDQSALGAGTFSAVSQDGVTRSGFDLSYLPSCAGMTGGCWSFRMADADTVPASTTMVTSPVTVSGDRWVHLVGAHDATTQKVTLWVCEIGTPAEPGAGEPISASQTRAVAPWKAAGAFALGRGQQSGQAAAWWPGRIDNVRVFSGQIVAEAKIRRMCQGAEASDFTTGLDALDPTTTDGE